MNKKHLIAIFALVIALIFPVTMIGISLAGDTVTELAEDALCYEGVAAKAVTQPGLRSMWRVKDSNVKGLEDKQYTVYYGALVGVKNDTNQNGEALTVTYNAESKTVALTSGVKNAASITVYSSDSSGSNKFVSQENGYSIFAYTTLFGFEDKDLFGTDLVYAGWLVTVSDSGEVAYYYDYPAGTALATRLETYEKNGELYYASLNLPAVCDYFVNEYRASEGEPSFENNLIMNTVIDEHSGLCYDDLSLGFAMGESTHVGKQLNLVSGVQNMHLLHVCVAEEGYYSVRIRYALADASQAVRFYLRSRLDNTAVSTIYRTTSVSATKVDGGYTVPDGTAYAEEKLYIYLTAGDHVLDLWTDTKTTAAVSSLLLRCDRQKNALSLKADIEGYEVRTNGYEVVKQVASNADNPAGNFAVRGYLSRGASLSSTNPTRMGYAQMKTGSYFDYTFSVGTAGVYEVIGDVGIGTNSALHIYDITGLGLTTGEAWTPDINPIFTASKATVGGTAARVTETLGEVRLKSGNRTLRIYAEGSINFRSVSLEKDDVNFLTVNYVSESGAVLAPQKLLVLDRYTRYDIPSPSVAGYRPDMATVSGYLTEDKTVTVTYSVDATATDRTVTFIYGLNGEKRAEVTTPIGEAVTVPDDAAILGYHLTWYDAYETPVYSFDKLGNGTVLRATYEKNVVFSVNATEMVAAKNAALLESDNSLLKITHSSAYYTTGEASYLRIPVSVPVAGIYELRIKGVSDGDFDLAVRVDEQDYVYISHVKNNTFVRNTLAMTNAEKLGTYTSEAQLWVYLPEGEHTVDLCIKGVASTSSRKAANALAVYAAEFSLSTGILNDAMLSQSPSNAQGSESDAYSGGTVLNTANGFVEYTLTVPKDGYYDVYFFLGSGGATTVTASANGTVLGSLTKAFASTSRGAEPVKFHAELTEGTNTLRLSVGSSVQTQVMGVVTVFRGDFIYHNATFVYGDKETTAPVIHGHKAMPPADAEREGYVLKWIDESGNTVTDFTVLGDVVYTAKYIDVNVTVTFVYGTETISVPAQIGNSLTPPEEANKEGYVLKWIDEDGNLVTDFTVKGHTTYTARYTGNTDYEIFATEMTPHGQNYLAADPSILVMTSGTSVTLSITVQTTGVYKLGMRGKADTFFEIYLDNGGFRYGELWNNTSGAVYVENTDYTMTAEEKKAAYRYGTGNCYVYLEKGTTYEFLMTTRNAGTDTTGSVGVFSVLFSLEHEVADIAETPVLKDGVSTNAYYQNANGCCFTSATAYADYELTLDQGVYYIGGLAGTAKATAYHFTVTDAEGNTVGTVSTPSAMYGSYKTGCVPAISESTLVIEESGVYTVHVTVTTTGYANNLSGIFAKELKDCNVTFIYDGNETSSSLPAGTKATPPAAAEKEGYILQWIDESGNVATDFTVKSDAVYTAKYIDKNVTVTFIYGNETVSLPTQIGNTVTPPSSAEKEGYIVKWLDQNGEIVTDFTVTGNLTFTAQYTYAMKEITFIYEGVTKTVLVMLGDKATPPAESKKEGHIIEWLDENGNIVTDFTVTGNATYTARYVYAVKEITFIYGSESVTYQLLLGEVATSPSAAEKTGFIIQWIDENDNLITDLTVTGNATYTARYVDYTKVEVLAKDMNVVGGSYFLENDKSVLIVENGKNAFSNKIYITIPVTVYKTGVYAFSARGLANTGFDFGIYDGNRSYGATWSNKTSPIYNASADFENGLEGIKTADYRYDVPTCYIYLEAGMHELRFATKQATTTENGGKVALYSVEFAFMYENVAPTPTNVSGTTQNGSNGIKLASADAFAEYTLTLKAGVYSFGAFVGTSKASVFSFTVIDENGNTVATVQSPNTLYGAYQNGSMPATATETVSIRKAGVYTVHVTVTTVGYLNNLFGVFAEWVGPYVSTEANVTFVYEGGEKTVMLTLGDTATPPAEAEKADYIIEWLDENGNIVTDFTVTGNATYTARYVYAVKEITFAYGSESVTYQLLLGDTATPPAEAEKDGFILEWLDENGNIVTDFTVTGDAVYTASYKSTSASVTFVYGEESITHTLTIGDMATPPAEAEKDGFILEWLDGENNVVTDFTVTGDAVYTARYTEIGVDSSVVFEATIKDMVERKISNVSFGDRYKEDNPDGFLKDPDGDGYYSFAQSTASAATNATYYITITFTVSKAGQYNINYDYKTGTSAQAPQINHYLDNGAPVQANYSIKAEGGYSKGATVYLTEGEHTIILHSRRRGFEAKSIQIKLADEQA